MRTAGFLKGVLVASAVTAAILTVWVLAGSRRGDELATPDVGQLSISVTAPVESRRLIEDLVLRVRPLVVQDEVTAPGEVAGVVTRVALTSGRGIEVSAMILSIDARPVFAVEGAFPFFREIRHGDRGDDVAQLQRVLQASGLALVVDGVFGDETQDALERFYEARDFDAPRSTSGEPPETAVLQAAVLEAEIELELRRAALDQLGTVNELELRRAEVDVALAEARLEESRSNLRHAIRSAGAYLRPAEFWVRDDWDMVPGEVVVRVGDRVQPGTVLWRDEVELGGFGGSIDRISAERVEPGLGALIELPDIGEVAATVVDVTDQTAADPDERAATVMLTLALRDPLPPGEVRADRTYKAVLRLADSATPVLAVPLAALTDGPDGAIAVQVVEHGPDGERDVRMVQVDPGLTAGGFVEVRPGAGERLVEGDRVVTGVVGDVHDSPDETP